MPRTRTSSAKRTTRKTRTKPRKRAAAQPAPTPPTDPVVCELSRARFPHEQHAIAHAAQQHTIPRNELRVTATDTHWIVRRG